MSEPNYARTERLNGADDDYVSYHDTLNGNSGTAYVLANVWSKQDTVPCGVSITLGVINRQYQSSMDLSLTDLDELIALLSEMRDTINYGVTHFEGRAGRQEAA